MAAGDLALNILIGSNPGGALAGINQIASSLKGLASPMTLMGTAALGMAATFVGASVTAAMGFQSSMAKVQAYASMTQQQTNDMAQSILQMAPALGEAPQALADSLYFVASAGFKGADALTVLKYAGMTAAASNTDATVTTSALVGSLNALKLSAGQAGNVSDILNATVSNGILTWQQYGSVVGKIAGAVSVAGGDATTLKNNFIGLNAALDVYSNTTITAHQASQWLNADMTVLYGKTGALATNAKKLGISFDASKFASMDFAQRLQYLNQVTDGNRNELTKLLGGNSVVANSVMFLNQHYGTLSATIADITSKMRGGQTTADKFAIQQQTLAFQVSKAKAQFDALMITVGSKLLPVLTNLVSHITPIITNFTTWIGQGDNLRNVLIAVGIVIAALLVPAVWSLAAGVIAATWPFLLIGAAIAGVVLIFKHFYETNAGFKAFIDGFVHGLQQAASFVQANFMPAMRALGSGFQTYIMPFLRDIGSFVVSTFVPIWQQLVAVWNGQLLPLLKQLWGALQSLWPVIQMIGGILAAVAIVQIGLIVGAIKGFIAMLGVVIHDLISFIGGIVQFFTGIVQMVSGIVRFIVDLVTGNFKNLGSDLGMIWQGILNMFGGVFQAMGSLFHAFFGGIIAFIGNFIMGVVHFFQMLADHLVGHSIIPDMLNAIKNVFQAAVSWLIGIVSGFVSGVIGFFTGLWQKAVAIWNMLTAAIRAILMAWITNAIMLVVNFVNGLQQRWNSLVGIASGIFNTIKNTILGILQNLVGLVFQAGANIVNGIANGIKSAIGAVGNAIGAVGAFISSHLPHSPAKMGPLRDLLMQGQMISQQIGEGIRKGTPHVQAALNATLAPQGSFALATPTNSSPQTINMTVQLDGQTLTKVVGARVAREIRIAGGVRNV